MDLTLEDVADLLNVSESTVEKWLKQRKIPAYKLDNQFRFSRVEIENWVMNKNRMDEKTDVIDLNTERAHALIGKKIGTQAFSLYRAIFRGGVIDEVAGKDKEEVIRSSVKKISTGLHLDSSVLTDLLLDREKLMPTSLNHGIGVPHTRDFLIPKTYDIVTIAYPERPIEYGALDGEKVHTLFFLFACNDKRHLHLLAKLAHFTRNEENLAFLLSRPGKKEILEYIKKWEAGIALNVEV